MIVRLYIFLGCLLALPYVVLAATSDFSVRTIVGEDTTPPTTPTLLTAEPISFSQIDLTWTPSSDDYALSGYTIQRDGAHIATTTLTTFSDTGLLASTTYEYTVRAFDWLINFSTPSNVLATTTLTLPPPAPTTTPTTTAARAAVTASGRLMLRSSVTVAVDAVSATFAWETSRPSRFELRWGRTASYELGFVTTERFREDHLTTLTDLLPGTTYEYELVGYNTANNIPQILARGQFTTAVPELPLVVPNVRRLTGVALGNDVALSWQNPGLPAGYLVRVVRNHLGFPIDTHDGMVVYQGRGETWYDRGALTAREAQYYTVFVVAGSGDSSSGAVVRMVKSAVTAPAFSSGDQAEQAVLTKPPQPPDLPLPLLLREAIVLEQGGQRFTFADAVIPLSSFYPFTLSIPKEALPPHLKSIIVTLLDPTDHRQSYAFLLRLNADGAAYEATLTPLEVSGVSELTIEVYDFETRVVGRYGKQITFAALAREEDAVFFPDALVAATRHYGWVVWVLVGVSVFLLLLLWRQRRRGDSE